jgi:hypothetical protein
MTNHVHLLMTPHEAGATSRMMQAIGRRYVGAFNARYRRTGTLWEGRFKSALVDSTDYVLTCYRYIELNRARRERASNMPQTRCARYRNLPRRESGMSACLTGGVKMNLEHFLQRAEMVNFRRATTSLGTNRGI